MHHRGRVVSQARAERAHLRREPRPRFEHRRSVHRAAAAQARRRRRSRPCAGSAIGWTAARQRDEIAARATCMLGAVLWTIGLLAVWAIALTLYAARRSTRSSSSTPIRTRSMVIAHRRDGGRLRHRARRARAARRDARGGWRDVQRGTAGGWTGAIPPKCSRWSTT